MRELQAVIGLVGLTILVIGVAVILGMLAGFATIGYRLVVPQ